MTSDTIEGRCLCGAVGYVATAPPTASMVCHCRSCRWASAAPLIPWVTFPVDRFEFTRGMPSKFASSPGVTRTFCPACGTPLTYQHADRAFEIDVTTCTLGDPERFPPTHHSWTSHDLRWTPALSELPMHPEFKTS